MSYKFSIKLLIFKGQKKDGTEHPPFLKHYILTAALITTDFKERDRRVRIRICQFNF